MAIKDVIAEIRKEYGLTQAEMARELYVTRQAISRWETGETEPGVDMIKLIAVTFGVPLERFFDMPASYFCQCCGMPIPDPAIHGTNADGGMSEDYCKFCYQGGEFTAKDISMDDFIEATAVHFVREQGGTLDDAVSFMATMLPRLKRWMDVEMNERLYGKEVREKFGDEVMDAANAKYMSMTEFQHMEQAELEQAIKEQLKVAMAAGDSAGAGAAAAGSGAADASSDAAAAGLGAAAASSGAAGPDPAGSGAAGSGAAGSGAVGPDPSGPEAQKLVAMHAAWVSSYWPEGLYSGEAYRGLADGYLADKRFQDYYEPIAEGATQFLRDAIYACTE